MVARVFRGVYWIPPDNSALNHPRGCVEEGRREGSSNFLRLHGLVDYAGTGKGLILRGRLRRRDTTWPPLNRISSSCKQIAPEEPKSSTFSASLRSLSISISLCVLFYINGQNFWYRSISVIFDNKKYTCINIIEIPSDLESLKKIFHKFRNSSRVITQRVPSISEGDLETRFTFENFPRGEKEIVREEN